MSGMSLLNTYRFITDAPLNRGRRASAFVRFAKWQVGSRLVPGRVVHDWVNGSQFLVGQGERGLTGNIYNGLHEFEDMGFLLHFLRPADLFVDVGANAGSFTILASSVIGARTVAFEPIPSTFERLEENVRLNDIDALVTCVNGGVAASGGRITFTTGDDAMNHVAAPGAETDTGMSVEVTTLDTALHGEDPALIKIDVEGFELPVLEGATRTLERPGLRAVIAELNGGGRRYGFDDVRVVELLRDVGFEPLSYDPLGRALSGSDGTAAESKNVLFIRDREFVEDRVVSAPDVAVLDQSF